MPQESKVINHVQVQQTKRLMKIGLVSCLALTIGMQSASAQSQDSDDEALEEIVVTGVRNSLLQSVQAKRNASIISDVITATDIGKFPDENLAESLQRITGVQITRSRGEGENVTIRGLPTDFTRVQLNGRTLASATGSRSFDFTILASDFVRTLEVQKSPTADAEEGGIAGTVNVKTLRPLDVGETLLVGSVFGQYDDNADSVEPKASLLYSDVYADGKFGLTLGVSYSKRALAVDTYEAFGLEPANESADDPALRDFNVDGDLDDAGFAFNHAANFGIQLGERERISAIANFQFRPADNVEFWFDGLYSSFDTTGILPLNSHRFTFIRPARAGDPFGVVASETENFNGTEVLTFFDADAVDLRNNARQFNTEDELYSLAFGSEVGISDRLTGKVEFSYSSSRRRTTNLSLEVIGRASVSQDQRTDFSGIPSLAYQRGFDGLDPNNLRAIGFNGGVDVPTDDDNIDVRLDFDYELGGFFTSLEFGGKFSDRTRFNGNNTLLIGAEDLAGVLGQTFEADVEGGSFNASSFVTLFEPDNFLNAYNGSSVFPQAFVSADPRLVTDQIPLDQLVAQFGLIENQAAIFTVNEQNWAGYAKANFEDGDSRLAGNIGVRLVHTRQSSSGNLPDLNQLVFTQQGAQTLTPVVRPDTVTGTYTKLLPSLNVSYELTDDVVVRFAAARALSRAPLGNLSPATAVNLNVGTLTTSNPSLGPQTADQLDLSVEYYFGEGSLFSVAGFYKNVKDAIIQGTGADVILTGILQESGEEQQFSVTPFFPVNSDDSVKVRGFEVSYQQTLSFLPQPFDGLGVIANYTFVDTSDDVLSGISKHNYNLIGYYENDRFSIRGAYNYRSSFPVTGINFFGDGANTAAFGQFDASLNVKLMENVNLVVEAINLFEEAVVQTNDIGFNRGFEDSGRRIIFGVRAKF